MVLAVECSLPNKDFVVTTKQLWKKIRMLLYQTNTLQNQMFYSMGNRCTYNHTRIIIIMRNFYIPLLYCKHNKIKQFQLKRLTTAVLLMSLHKWITYPKICPFSKQVLSDKRNLSMPVHLVTSPHQPHAYHCIMFQEHCSSSGQNTK